MIAVYAAAGDILHTLHTTFRHIQAHAYICECKHMARYSRLKFNQGSISQNVFPTLIGIIKIIVMMGLFHSV